MNYDIEHSNKEEWNPIKKAGKKEPEEEWNPMKKAGKKEPEGPIPVFWQVQTRLKYFCHLF